MRYLLDTNVVSELRKRAADPAVREFVTGRPATELAASVITIMEIEIGVGRVERRDPRQGAALRSWLEHRVLPGFGSRVLSLDLAAVRLAARLHVPDPRPERDALIAATAIRHRLTLVTRNVSDFATTGVELVDPWGT